MIGIRLADRSLFPVLEEDTPGRRHVVLVTAVDDQVRALIELYRIIDDEGEFLETIVVDNLPPRPSGEAEMDLDMTVTADRTLLVRVQDGDTGNVQSVSLDLDEYAFPSGAFSVSSHDESHRTDEPDGVVFAAVSDSSDHNRRRWWPIALVAFLLLGAAAALVLLLPSDRGQGSAETPARSTEAPPPSPQAPSPEEAESVATQPAVPEPLPEEAPAVEASPGDAADSTVPDTAVESTRDEQRTETEYRIQRGDTLWELSERFYGTPWAYPNIAEENDIADPDLIFPEDAITIPDGR
ncbi:MAG: LysM peptidoglycan-binding domain-containing protein [Spirochaetales bacterium]|nr:LysM peptidoglycan-binding domain-containing protein [Spirochaetales bacterium]